MREKMEKQKRELWDPVSEKGKVKRGSHKKYENISSK
jgi:hypothetical protein